MAMGLGGWEIPYLRIADGGARKDERRKTNWELEIGRWKLE